MMRLNCAMVLAAVTSATLVLQSVSAQQVPDYARNPTAQPGGQATSQADTARQQALANQRAQLAQQQAKATAGQVRVAGVPGQAANAVAKPTGQPFDISRQRL